MQTNTLEKIKFLEAYLAVDNAFVDSVLDKSITKLVIREQMRMQHLKQRLQQQLSQFEQNYNLLSQEFYNRYNQGEMGDEMDFIEWASTIEMLINVEKRMVLLGNVKWVVI